MPLSRPATLNVLFHLRVVGINVGSLLKSFSEQIGRQAAKIPILLRISWDKISRNFLQHPDVATFHQIVFWEKKKNNCLLVGCGVLMWIIRKNSVDA
jgi:hypothetical protein